MRVWKLKYVRAAETIMISPLNITVPWRMLSKATQQSGSSWWLSCGSVPFDRFSTVCCWQKLTFSTPTRTWPSSSRWWYQVRSVQTYCLHMIELMHAMVDKEIHESKVELWTANEGEKNSITVSYHDSRLSWRPMSTRPVGGLSTWC